MQSSKLRWRVTHGSESDIIRAQARASATPRS